MYYQNYEDYMRTVLGYIPQCSNIYESNDYILENNNCQNKKEIQEMYPEIYKILNPIIVDTCNNCQEPINKNNIEIIINEIYKKIENNKEILIKVNIDNRNDDRQVRRNPLFNDLIRIILLNNLLGGGYYYPPYRPPFPGGPGPIKPGPRKTTKTRRLL